MWHRRFPGSVEEWHGDLVSSSWALGEQGVAMVVLDPLDGRILSATTAVAGLLGSAVPGRTADLVEHGRIARPDLTAIVDHLDAWRRLDRIEGGGRESSHSWSTLLRIHSAAGPKEVVVDILHHRRPAIDAEAVIATIHTDAHGTHLDSPLPAGLSERFWLVYDHQMRIVAADPRMARIGVPPKSQVGVLAAVTVHPEDVPIIHPLVVAVINEELEVAHYAVRIRGAEGWVRVQVELRRLLAPSGPMLVGAVQPLPDARRAITPGTLTPREATIVHALFDGLRVTTIAERDGVAVKTVRNQLAAVYRKLDVTGQEELLGTFTRPVG